MQMKRWSTLSLVITLSSCGLFGPSYRTPELGAKDAVWNSTDDLANISNQHNLPYTAWWKSFDDPVLNTMISYALKNNNNIQQAIGNVINAQGSLEQVKMGWVPTVNAAAGYNTSGAFVGPGTSATSQATIGSGSGYQVGIVPAYTLNILQQIRSQQVAEANLAAMKYATDAMRLTVISQVAGSYFTLRQQDYQLVLQQQLLKDTAKQYELAKEQYTQGFISLLSLQNYQQQYEAAKAQIPITEYNIVQTKNALLVLLNHNPSDLVRGLNFLDIRMYGIIPANLPSVVLRSRPDIMQAEQQLISANASIGVATSTFFPSIGLTGFNNGIGTASNQLNSLFSGTSSFWAINTNAVMPIMNLAVFGQIKGAKGTYYAAYFNYVQTVRNAFAQVDNGLATHDKITQSYKDQALVYDSTKLAYELGKARFKDGADSLVTMLTYKINMDNAAITLAQLKLQQLQNIVNLYQALAGGYNVESDATPKRFGDGHDI